MDMNFSGSPVGVLVGGHLASQFSLCFVFKYQSLVNVHQHFLNQSDKENS